MGVQEMAKRAPAPDALMPSLPAGTSDSMGIIMGWMMKAALATAAIPAMESATNWTPLHLKSSPLRQENASEL